jgi:hypothetical protein
MQPTLLALSFLALTCGAQAEHPWTGLWKLDHSQSDFGAMPPQQQQFFRFETLGKALRFTEYGVAADGKAFTLSYTGRLDGAEHPLDDDRSSSIRVMLSQEGEDTLAVTGRRDGVTVRSYKMRVSPDGQTLTFFTHNTRVYARQHDRREPWVGNWVLARSASEGDRDKHVLRLESLDNGMALHERTTAAGGTTFTAFVALFDGKHRPLTVPASSKVSVVARRAGRDGLVLDYQQDGAPWRSWKLQVAENGRQLLLDMGQDKRVYRRE